MSSYFTINCIDDMFDVSYDNKKVVSNDNGLITFDGCTITSTNNQVLITPGPLKKSVTAYVLFNGREHSMSSLFGKKIRLSTSSYIDMTIDDYLLKSNSKGILITRCINGIPINTNQSNLLRLPNKSTSKRIFLAATIVTASVTIGYILLRAFFSQK